jgi:HNH endonuclease
MVALHRLVAASVLNRDLEPGEVVHHLNGDKTDNNHPENLRVLPSQ